MKKVNLLLALLILFYSCKKDDPCEGITCENNGTCDNGKCLCQGLWEGEKCTEQVTPHGIISSGITLTKMPATDTGGAGWDLTSGADLYIIVKLNGVQILNTSNDVRTNSGVNTSWNSLLNIEAFDDVSIDVYDYDDFDADDYIGGIHGTIYFSTNGFPTTVQLQCASCPVWVTFNNLVYL